MRKIAITGMLSALLLGTSFTISAADLAKFSTIAKDTMSQVSTGTVTDVDKLIAMQEELITIGKSAITEYTAAHPDTAKMLNLVKDNATKMSNMSLGEIEKEWHEKGFLKSQGISEAQLDEKSVTGSLMDTIVHPATAIIALRDYKTSKDKALLQQVHDELEEVVHHVERIKM